MRVFMTGATGYIGASVARALIARDHEVTALVRATSDDSRLRASGAAVVAGALGDLPDLDSVLRGCDAFIHCAIDGTDQTAELDRVAIDSMTRYAGPFIYTSGVWVLGNTGDNIADEKSPVSPLPISAWRAENEQRVLDAGTSGVATAVLRPGCVYGGRQDMLAGWFQSATRNAPVRVIGDGSNRWALVHVEDLAALYVRALETGATGVLHGVDDSDARLGAMAQAVVSKSGRLIPIEYTPARDARAQLGDANVEALTVDQRVASDATRAKVGWKPRYEFISSVGQQWDEWFRSRGLAGE